VAEEQFLAMLRFAPAGRNMLEELPTLQRGIGHLHRSSVAVQVMDLVFPHDAVAGVVLDQHVSVKSAAEIYGCHVQYLRRLLRNGHLDGIEIGQFGLIKLASLEVYLQNGQMVRNRRRGPRESAAEAGKKAAR
jgi:hypothetical protein